MSGPGLYTCRCCSAGGGLRLGGWGLGGETGKGGGRMGQKTPVDGGRGRFELGNTGAGRVKTNGGKEKGWIDPTI